MALFEQISKDIVVAMKAKDKVALEALRNIKKFFLEAKTAPGANDELTDDAAMKILAKLAKQGKDTAALYVEQGRQDLADEELAQVEVISRYLPKQLSAEELEQEYTEKNAGNQALRGACFQTGERNVQNGQRRWDKCRNSLFRTTTARTDTRRICTGS